MSFETGQEPLEGNQAEETREPQGQPETTPSEDAAGLFSAMLDRAGKRIAGHEPTSPSQGDGGNPNASETPGGEQEDSQPQGNSPDKQEEPRYPVTIDGKTVELSLDQMREYASKGADYTRKTMELANQRKQIEGFQALIDLIQRDPAYAKHVFYGYQPQGTPQGQAQHRADDVPPDDPIERIKWEAKREAKAEALSEMRPLADKLAALEANTTVSTVVNSLRSDPLHEYVKQGMMEYVNAQPPKVRDHLIRTMDADLDTFMDTYNSVRERVVEAINAQRSQAQGGNANAPQGQQPGGMRVVQKQAPRLESPGTGGETPTRKEQSLRALSKTIRSGKATSNTLGDFLSLTGVFDRLDASRSNKR